MCASHTAPDQNNTQYTKTNAQSVDDSISREKYDPGPVVKWPIIGQKDNEQRLESLQPLCHSAPNTQRASNTLAQSSLLSSVRQRRYCLAGSALSRRRCLFCGLWHLWVAWTCRATPAFTAILLRSHVTTDKTNKSLNR